MGDKPDLYLRLLGPVALLEPDASVVEFSAIQSKLLSRLAISAPQPVGLDALVEAVWGTNPPASARQSIQNQISRIRTRTDHDVIATQGGGYVLGVSTDVILMHGASLEAERLLHTGDAEGAFAAADTALGLWHGEPAADIESMNGLVAFRYSVHASRELIEILRLEAALALGMRSWTLPEAIRLSAESPLDERRVAGYARSLMLNGRRGDALAVIGNTRRQLRTELGVDGGSYLDEVELEIVGSDPSTTMHGGTVSNSRLFGRETEIDTILNAIQQAKAVQIVGEPGSGVSRLLLEAAIRMNSLGHRCVMVRAERHPLEPVSLIEEILDELGVTVSGVRGVLSSFVNLLESVSRTKPVVLIVDDAHFVGPSSWQALEAAASASGVTVLVGAHGPELSLSGSLCVELGPLEHPAVSAIARSYGLSDGSTLDWLATESGGNALVVHLLIDTIKNDPSFVATSNWSPDLGQLVDRLTAHLDAAQRYDLQVAAVGGDRFPVEAFAHLARTVSSNPPDGLVDWLDDGTQRFRHGAVRDLLYVEMPRGQVIDLHFALAHAAQKVGAPNSTVASHFLAAESLDPDAAIDACRLAASDATRVGAHADSAEWLSQALAIARDRNDALALEISIEYADALRLSGDPSHVDKLVSAIQRALRHGNDELIAGAAFALLQLGGTTGLGDSDSVVGKYAHLAMEAIVDPELRSRVDAAASLAWSMSGNEQRCAEMFERAEKAAITSQARRQVLPFAYLALGHPKDLGSRRILSEELVELAREANDPVAMFEATHLKFSTHLQHGEGHLMRRSSDEMKTLISRVGDVGRRWATLYCSAAVAHIDGNDELCEKRSDEAFAIFSPVAPERAYAVYGSQLLPLRLGQGRLGELRDILADMVSDQSLVTAWHSAFALALAVDEPDTSARELASIHIRAALDNSQRDFTWLSGQVITASAAALIRNQALIEECLVELEPWAHLVAWQGTCSYGPVAHVLAMLYSAANDVENARRYLEQGNGLAESLGTPPEVTEQRLDLAFRSLVPCGRTR